MKMYSPLRELCLLIYPYKLDSVLIHQQFVIGCEKVVYCSSLG